MKIVPTLSIHLSLLTIHLLAANAAFAQGSLTPPGAPAPVFKTLHQVEPRTDLQAPTLPPGVTTDANYHFIINQAGSYYLSAPLNVTKTNGILINADGVSFDLNGFHVARSSGSGGNGIEISSISYRASIRNGTVKEFSNGILNFSAKALSLRDLSAAYCTFYGFFAGDGAVLENCRAYANAGNSAIAAGVGSILVNCSATYNNTDYGIYAYPGSTLTNCNASNNGSLAAQSAGINATDGCSVVNCSAYANTTGNPSPSFATGMGIVAGNGVTIKDCTVRNNYGAGIRVNGACLVTGNNSSLNGVVTGAGDGIRTAGDNNRIDGNHVVGNGQYGIRSSTTNVIVRNTSSGNGINYDVSSGANFGPLQTPGTATSPWANF